MELVDHISAASQSQEDRDWVCEAVERIAADYNRSSDTHLIRLNLPGCDGISLYLKDESTHPSGSLKHRLARSLFLYGLCNGRIGRGTTIVEASLGSTAISEAYFAQLLGLPFIAVVPKATAHEKIEEIEFHGGECHKVEPQAIYHEAERLAGQVGGHYMDQFTYAERATDWRGSSNIAESLFSQMARGAPSGAGLGGDERRNRGHLGHSRALYPLPAGAVPQDPVMRRRSGELGVFRLLPDPGCGAAFGQGVADRGHRAAARRAVVPARCDRPHDAGPRCRLDRHDLVAGAQAGAQMRRLDRDQCLRRAGDHG